MVRKYDDCYVCPSIPDLDGPLLYENMRMEDMLECIGLGIHPRIAVEQSLKQASKAFTIWNWDYDLVGCFGVCKTDNPNVGCGWLLGTDLLGTVRKTFVRHSKEWLETVMGDYIAVVNVVSVNNKLSVRWLRWLGAEWLRPLPGDYMEFSITNVNKTRITN